MTSHLSFWGKARPPADAPNPGWHPIGYHLLDVAAVMEAFLAARPAALQRASRLLRLEDGEAAQLLITLAALHDLGKFAPAFQVKAPDLWERLSSSLELPAPLPGYHTEDGYALWSIILADALADRVWEGGSDVIERLGPAVFGHHGRPVGLKERRARQGFPEPALTAARACAEAVVELLCPEPIRGEPPRRGDAAIASWFVAGLMSTADWIGSSVRWFRYSEPLEDDPMLARYWNDIARPVARNAVREAGILAPAPAPLRPFHELTRLEKDPTPLQRWAESVALPNSPCLVVIEDVTGAGKTEAAQMVLHRLLAAGRAAGAYWGMPTQATANAMYERQAKVLDRLFTEDADPKPSLVLAHGQQRLHGGFQGTVLRGVVAETLPGQETDTASGIDDEPPGSVSCAAFLADDRRAALLADVGAGTIDQALLGVLPSKFNAVRLLGLADKVLVVDEAHAYDAYMSTELQELLRFQAALGGYAVVLSATLPQEQRRRLAAAWMDGLRLGGWDGAARSEEVVLHSTAYPLATVVSTDDMKEVPLGTAPWSARSVAVRWVHEVDAALEHAQSMAAAGAAVVWIRNTVDDCLAAAETLRQRGVETVLVFHARFAQCDRQSREMDVLHRFGKDASVDDRAGWVLLSTQVVEQSLDIDFDAMISDLAPIDLLIQRVGRLWRHAGRDVERPAACRREIVVLSPQRNADPPKDWLGGIFGGTAAVYQNAGVLWRTVDVLDSARCIETPGGVRALVEAVYGSDQVPDSLLAVAQRAEAKDLGDSSTAQYGTLKVTHGYDAAQQPWVDDLRVPTRLGDEDTTVRLARVQPDGSLAPWSDASPAWRAWALSEVRVRRNRIPPDAAPLPQYELAAAAARREWGRFEQVLPILPLVAMSSVDYEGEMVRRDAVQLLRVRYSAAEGLVFPADS
jgi:CRISPR-associated endonuclease/helicase Cas3